jgi:hypothetical protein
MSASDRTLAPTDPKAFVSLALLLSADEDDFRVDVYPRNWKPHAVTYDESLARYCGATFILDGTGQWLGSRTPWHEFVALPGGVTYSLAAGARVLAEIYYGTSDERVADAGRLGLFFSDEPATAPTVSADLVLEASGEVPAGASMQRFRSEARIAEGTRLLSLLPRLDPGIQSLEVSLRRPDGGTEILLFAKDIRLEWPTPYIFREPVVVPRGLLLRGTAYFENTSNGPQPGGFSLTVSRY